MNKVEVTAEDVPLPAWSPALTEYAGKVLSALKKDNWDLSVLLCGNSYIKSLNAQYRGKDEATDVLSFALGETIPGEDGERRYLSGDIVISLETLGENARSFEIPEDEELRRLLIHGILHLDGMDHATNNETEPMLRLQEKILVTLAGEHILFAPFIPHEGAAV
ncbi:MAG: rRNA maturation RNase YbeY [Treponema sp.]|jgi:probable rRNA maturation factor|nr:rRNA maturation RNase YbeY [Treponema sp.]